MLNKINIDLIRAVYSCNYNNINLLIKLGADVKYFHSLGLRIATEYKFIDIMELLLINGADYKDVENYLLSVDNYRGSNFLMNIVNNLKIKEILNENF